MRGSGRDPDEIKLPEPQIIIARQAVEAWTRELESRRLTDATGGASIQKTRSNGVARVTGWPPDIAVVTDGISAQRCQRHVDAFAVSGEL